MALRGLLAGPKVSNKHSTVIPAAVPLVKAAKRHEGVSRVVLSAIKAIPTGPPRLKLTPVPAGLRMVVRGPRCAQTFFVYTQAPAAVHDYLRTCWEAQY